MRKIYVYAGYYELYITDKKMPGGFMYQAEFDSVAEAEAYVDESDDWLWLDRDLINESGYSWDGEDYEYHTFDFEARISELV